MGKGSYVKIGDDGDEDVSRIYIDINENIYKILGERKIHI